MKRAAYQLFHPHMFAQHLFEASTSTQDVRVVVDTGDCVLISIQRYRLIARLDGHTGAINCFCFARGSMLLASGGDDETIRLWDLTTKTCREVLFDHGGRWGQITSLKWDAMEAQDAGTTLYFGTGRGLFLVYRHSNTLVCDGIVLEAPADYYQSSMIELSNTHLFSAGDGIEAIAYDPEHRRVAITSHYGCINVCALDKNSAYQGYSLLNLCKH
jgi:WD40 repeat protein